jgi:hypothetical protein
VRTPDPECRGVPDVAMSKPPNCASRALLRIAVWTKGMLLISLPGVDGVVPGYLVPVR